MTRDMMSGVENSFDARIAKYADVNSQLRFVLKSRAASGTAVDERRGVYLKGWELIVRVARS